jgi:hypothetical protein
LSAKGKDTVILENDSTPNKVDQKAGSLAGHQADSAPPGADSTQPSDDIVTSRETKSSAEPSSEKSEYIGSCMPANEGQRWGYLCSLNILDTVKPSLLSPCMPALTAANLPSVL